MDDLYIKDDYGNYVPIKFDITSAKELNEKLLIVTVGNDKEPATPETVDYISQCFLSSKMMIDAMRNSQNANLLILPHTIKVELISKLELDKKTICLQLSSSDAIDNLPEIKKRLKETIQKEIVILPLPILLKEYKEIKAIKERLKIRKKRYGGGLNTCNK